MSHLPYEGYSYYVNDSYYHMNAIVPFSTYNYRVEVLSPVLPLVEETVTLPTVKLSDVKKWVGSLEGLVDDTDSKLYPLFLLLRDIAKQIIVYELIDNEDMYIRAVSYYVGHYMELHLKALKDQQNKMTMSYETSNDVDDIKKIEITMLDDHYGTFKQTIYGRMYWAVYGVLTKYDIGYVPI